jgi:hypothetical protein
VFQDRQESPKPEPKPGKDPAVRTIAFSSKKLTRP